MFNAKKLLVVIGVTRMVASCCRDLLSWRHVVSSWPHVVSWPRVTLSPKKLKNVRYLFLCVILDAKWFLIFLCGWSRPAVVTCCRNNALWCADEELGDEDMGKGHDVGFMMSSGLMLVGGENMMTWKVWWRKVNFLRGDCVVGLAMLMWEVTLRCYVFWVRLCE